jgi:hypothetical protein
MEVPPKEKLCASGWLVARIFLREVMRRVLRSPDGYGILFNFFWPDLAGFSPS